MYKKTVIVILVCKISWIIVMMVSQLMRIYLPSVTTLVRGMFSELERSLVALVAMASMFFFWVAGEGAASVPMQHLVSMLSTFTHLCACGGGGDYGDSITPYQF